jgi:hypothetical protein
MLFREIHRTHKYTVWAKGRVPNVKAGGMYSYRYFKGLKIMQNYRGASRLFQWRNCILSTGNECNEL